MFSSLEIELHPQFSEHLTVFFPFVETEGFKIDTMGTYHGMTLKSVTVRSELFFFLSVLSFALH